MRLRNLLFLAVPPLTATLLLVNYAKAKSHPNPLAAVKLTYLNQCVTAINGEEGAASQLGPNQVCTCLADKLPKESTIQGFLKTKSGAKALGQCIFLAKDGL